MVERLSVDFIRKLFVMLTSGNAQIKFHTICMQNRNREKAANRPFTFGMKLLGYNIWYRLPLIRDIPVGRRIGKDFLTRCYLRLPVEDLSSEILENPQAVCDVENSLFLPVLSQESFFEKLEKKLDCDGFAKARHQYQDDTKPLEEIYRELNRTLSTSFSCKTELELARTNLIPNRYSMRLLDIAAYHEVKIHLVIDSSYPRDFYEELLRRNTIGWDSLSLSCESKKDKIQMVTELGLQHFGVVSADFNHFIRPLQKAGGRPIYYRAPVQLMKDALHPGLSSEFKEQYDAVCGAKVFSGQKRVPFLYELGYLCAGPLIYSLYSFLDADFTVCYAGKYSVFAKMTGSHAVCTMNGDRHFPHKAIQVLDPGFDPEGFAAFLKKLQKNHPGVSFRVLSLSQITSRDTQVMHSLFTGERSELNDGVRDFCHHYAKYTGMAPISIQDGVRLYRCGQQNLEKGLAVPTGKMQPAASV